MAKKDAKKLEKEQDIGPEIVEETAPDAEVQPESMDLSAELEQVKGELETQKNLLLRTAAEFDNYKRRTERERLAAGEYVTANTLKALLPIVDSMERAGEFDPDSAEYAKGIEMIAKQLMEITAKLGLTEIEAAGAPFDPALHDAVMHIEDEELGENTVAEVLQKGYKVGDTVVRHAMVKVAN